MHKLTQNEKAEYQRMKALLRQHNITELNLAKDIGVTPYKLRNVLRGVERNEEIENKIAERFFKKVTAKRSLCNSVRTISLYVSVSLTIAVLIHYALAISPHNKGLNNQVKALNDLAVSPLGGVLFIILLIGVLVRVRATKNDEDGGRAYFKMTGTIVLVMVILGFGLPYIFPQ